MSEEGEIVTYYKTDRRADKFGGVDFMLVKINGEKVPLQIKSSLAGMAKHLENFPDIPVIVVCRGDDTEIVKNKIKGVLE